MRWSCFGSGLTCSYAFLPIFVSATTWFTRNGGRPHHYHMSAFANCGLPAGPKPAGIRRTALTGWSIDRSAASLTRSIKTLYGSPLVRTQFELDLKYLLDLSNSVN